MLSKNSLLIKEQLNILSKYGQIGMNRQFIQHGKVTTYDHCLKVALLSCQIADFLKLKIDYNEMIRGSLLHDYYLYDWHIKDESHRLHGFHHAKKSLENANRDYVISSGEEDIILHHMFPLNITTPPQSVSAWVVCIADKISALMEIVK